jgi:hypothetical protein
MEAMTGEAWAFMIAVWAVVIGITGYCFWKLMSTPSGFSEGGDHDHPGGPLE